MRIVAGDAAGGHADAVQPPAFSPDGARLFSGDRAGWLIVRERRDGASFQVVARLQVPPAGAYSTAQVRAVAWPSADLVATHEHGAIRVRRADDLAEVHALPHVGTGTIATGGGGAWLAALGEAAVYVLGFPGLERRGHHWLARGGYEYFKTDTLAADPSGPRLAVGDDGGCDETAMGMRLRSGERRVTLIDAERGEIAGAIEAGNPVRQLVWDPWRGHVVAVTYGDVGIWSAAGELVRRFRPYETTHAVALALSARWMATAASHAYNRATLDLWDPLTFERLDSVPLERGVPPAWIVASPDGGTLLTPGLPRDGDFVIQAWSVAD
ncbi:MAG: hypothetical protein ACJ8GN_02615 [Longimicrobiaceae bacterium]